MKSAKVALITYSQLMEYKGNFISQYNDFDLATTDFVVFLMPDFTPLILCYPRFLFKKYN